MAKQKWSEWDLETSAAGAQLAVLKGGANKRLALDALGGASSYTLNTGWTPRTDLERHLDVRNIRDVRVIDKTGSTDVRVAFKAACDEAVAGGFAVFVPAGIYRLDSQLVIKGGLTLIMSPRAILLRNWAGSIGDRYNNALIRNENCYTNVQLVGTVESPVYEPAAPTTTDDDITIVGGRVRLADTSKTGGTFYLTATKWLRISGVVVEQSFDWAFAVGGDDLEVDRCKLLLGGGVYRDGVHVLHGNRIWVHDCDMRSGDDAFVVGTGYNLPIADVWFDNNKCASTHGHGAAAYAYRVGATGTYPPPTRKIQRVHWNGLRGTAGELSNGLVLFVVDTPRYQAASVTSTSVFRLPTTASSVDGFYVGGRASVAPGGTGTVGQLRNVIGYVGATREITVDAGFSTVDTGTLIDIEGCLVEDIRFTDVDLRSTATIGVGGTHSGDNPNGCRLDNIRNLYLTNVHMRGSIREAFYVSRIFGELLCENIHGDAPKVGGTTYYGMRFDDCPDMTWRGGTARALANHAVLLQGGTFAISGVRTPGLASSASGFNLGAYSTRPTDARFVGCRPSRATAATGTRLLRVSASGVTWEVDACDLSRVDDIVFESTAAAKRRVGSISTAVAGATAPRATSGNTFGYEMYGTVISNGGATGTVQAVLRPAVAGMRVRCLRAANFAFQIKPFTQTTPTVVNDTVGAGAAGKYMQIDTLNAIVDLECFVDGVWTIVNASPSATLTYEA